jgi:hypothetical protein
VLDRVTKDGLLENVILIKDLKQEELVMLISGGSAI